MNPFTFVTLQPFKTMLPSEDESYIVNVVPDSPRVLGLVTDTLEGSPNYKDVIEEPEFNIIPALEFLKSTVVIEGQLAKSMVF